MTSGRRALAEPSVLDSRTAWNVRHGDLTNFGPKASQRALQHASSQSEANSSVRPLILGVVVGESTHGPCGSKPMPKLAAGAAGAAGTATQANTLHASSVRSIRAHKCKLIGAEFQKCGLLLISCTQSVSQQLPRRSYCNIVCSSKLASRMSSRKILQ